MAKRVARWVCAIAISLLAACASQVPTPPSREARAPADFPDAYYRQLIAQGKLVWQIDSARSLLTVEVRRSGALAQFGHDHVIASHDIVGNIAPEERRADLFLPLDALTVDEPALRAQSGFGTQPSADDISGTNRNMREKVLETNRYPFVQVTVSDNGSNPSPSSPSVAVTLHGVTQIVEPAVKIEALPGAMEITGTFGIDQSTFGIAPFSILGGAIAVQDHIAIAFRLHAIPMQ